MAEIRHSGGNSVASRRWEKQAADAGQRRDGSSLGLDGAAAAFHGFFNSQNRGTSVGFADAHS